MLFVDTSFLLALVLKKDAYHAIASTLFQSANGRFLVTDYVLLETANGLSDTALRHLAIPVIGLVRTEPRIEIVPASQALMDQGLRLFHDRPDKNWSLTDCISFVVMQERGITDALSSDHHFEQAGFRALLRQG